MKKIISHIVFASLTLSTLMAKAAPLDAELKFGLAMGKNTQPQPVLAMTPFGTFKECFAIGEGSLVSERLEIFLDKMTCTDAHYFYEFKLKSALVTDRSGQSGIKTKHIPTSQSLLNSIKGLKDLYSKIKYIEGLKLIADAELGHWDVEPSTPIQIDFATTPELLRKTPLSR